MRVLHVYSGNLYGGIEAILVAMARAQGAGRVTHEFALCFEGRLAEELRAAGARVHLLAEVRLSRPQTARTARQALAGALAAHAFDRVVCHAPWSQAIFGGVARKAGVPLVFWAHDVMTGRHWTERLARRHVPDLVIGNSHFTLGTLPCLYPTAPSVVVYAPAFALRAMAGKPGDDPEVATKAERQKTRASLDTPDSAVVIIQASRAEAWKGHQLLVDALAGMHDVPNWIWWQAGGAQRPAEAAFLREVKAAAERAGIGDRVRWLGQRNDVPQLFAASDVYCQANLSPEPFGVVFVEALAAGLPVVTTGMGGAREIVTDACGVLVAADAREVAGALRRLVTDEGERARLSRSAPARARELSEPAGQLAQLAAALERMSLAGAHA